MSNRLYPSWPFRKKLPFDGSHLISQKNDIFDQFDGFEWHEKWILIHMIDI